jgi:predicted transposase/invertase (TIGR01784 family)
LRGELLALFDHEPDKQAVSLFLNWFQQVSDQGRYREIDPEALSHVYQNREEVQSMLVNAIARDRKKIYEEGLKEGKQEGLKEGEMKVNEGKQEEKRQIARALIARDMAVLEIAEITGLSEEDIREIMQAL